MIPRAVIYARCSTEEESQKDALAKQVAEARECVQGQNWCLVDSYVESRSGTSTKGRTEYTRLFQDLNKDKFDIIVIKSQDRLMRNTMDWYLFVERLTACGKKLYIYLERKFYSHDDALITGIKAILAEEYSRELSKKLNNAHRSRQKKGSTVLLTNNTYGYRKLEDKSVVIVEEEAAVKRRMYELCAAGYGCRRIASILQKDGIVNRKGNPFHDSDIRRMLRNPMNKGTIVMNRYHYDFDSKKTVKVPEEEQYVHKNRIPAIVSEELWERANREMDRRTYQGHGGNRHPPNTCPGRHALSRKLYCGLCGGVYYRSVRRHSDNQKIYEWKCSRYLQAGRNGCGNIHLKEDLLFQYLETACRNDFQPDTDDIAQKMQEMLKLVLQDPDSLPEMENAKKDKDKLKQQMSILLDKLLSGVISDSTYSIKYRELEERLEHLETKIISAETTISRSNTQEERISRIEKTLHSSSLVRKAILEDIVENIGRIVVYPACMDIYFISEDEEYTVRVDYGNVFNYNKIKEEEREAIVEMIRNRPCITAREIAEKMNISLSGANYRLKVLKREGRICFDGKGGKGTWIVKHYEKGEKL